jgi:hypothetical protein
MLIYSIIIIIKYYFKNYIIIYSNQTKKPEYKEIYLKKYKIKMAKRQPVKEHTGSKDLT